MTRPEDNPYDTLKACLICHTSLNQSQSVLSLRPLGDLIPSQLLRQIEQLADKNCNGDIIFQEIFLSHLLSSVQLILKSHPEMTIQEMSTLADTVITVATPDVKYSPSVLEVSSTTEAIISIRSEVDYLKRHLPKMMKSPRASVSSSTLCRYHTKFGKKRFTRPVMATTGSGCDSCLFLNDCTSGQHYLVNSGAEVSVLPTTSDR